jgi:hypothetical protein
MVCEFQIQIVVYNYVCELLSGYVLTFYVNAVPEDMLTTRDLSSCQLFK